MNIQTRKEQKAERLENISANEDGMSYDEIAKIMDLTVQQVKILERSALKKLKTPTTLNQKLYDYWGQGTRGKNKNDKRSR